MSLSIFLFVYNSRVASFHKKLLTKYNEEEYVENIQREFPDGIPTPKTLCSADRWRSGGVELRLDHKLS